MGRVRQWLTEMRRRRSAKAFILMYHRVATPDGDPWNLCVSPDRFEEQLRYLSGRHRVVALTQLLAEHRSRRLSDGTVAITFDDGYADNLHAAAPRLVRHGIPATFFITSGTVGSRDEFWWDRLERCLLAAAPLPGTLQISVAGAERRWDLGPAASDCVRPEGRRTNPWEASADSRLGFFYDVWKYLRALDDRHREEALAAIERWTASDRATRPTHRILTAEEVRELAALPGISVGAHSVSHAPLSARSPALQSTEIRQSREDLERLLGRTVEVFAYPFGDYAPETPGLVREAGYQAACIADPGAVWADVDPYLLPRLAVQDWDTTELDSALAVARR
jgi:peptidoglycan/xylan/chitin deacetylase (PgdA/CDA1 family)